MSKISSPTIACEFFPPSEGNYRILLSQRCRSNIITSELHCQKNFINLLPDFLENVYQGHSLCRWISDSDGSNQLIFSPNSGSHFWNGRKISNKSHLVVVSEDFFRGLEAFTFTIDHKEFALNMYSRFRNMANSLGESLDQWPNASSTYGEYHPNKDAKPIAEIKSHLLERVWRLRFINNT